MRKYLIGGIIFFLAATLCFVILGIKTVPDNYVRPEQMPDDGVLDLSKVDFQNRIAMIDPHLFTHYPEQLLEPDEPGKEEPYDVSPYGTNRILLNLPGGVYATSQTANDMAFRTMVDGKLVGTQGTVGTSISTSHPYGGTLLTGFAPDGEPTELSYQYSGFVRHYGPPSIYLGSVAQIAEQQERLVFRSMLFVGCMLTAMLMFLGMFFFFGRKKQFLFFSLCCLCLMIDNLVTGILPVTLLWPLSSAAVAQIQYLEIWGFRLFLFCYIDSVFPGVFHKTVKWAGAVIMAVYAGGILFLQPYVFTQLRDYALYFAVGMAAYVCVMLAVRARNLMPEQKFIMFAFLMMIAVNFSEQGVLRWILPYRFGNGFLTSCAMVGLVFLNMLALSVYAMRSEQELEQVRKLDKVRSQFLSNMSHEIKTPLTVISGYAQRALKQINEGGVDGGTRRGLLTISLEAQRLALLSEQLLDSSMEETDISASQKVDVSHIIHRITALCTPILEKNGNNMKAEIQEDCPPVFVNESMIIQVLINLCVNANRHTQNGRITVSASKADGMVRFRVRDNGEGIDPDVLPSIFERGFSRDGEGHGLGLSISKDVIESQGGSIEIESVKNQGTCVSFTLPAADAKTEAGS